MPTCLFTYHGRATWMPDHPRGYVHRTRGLRPTDPRMAWAYRRRQRGPAVRFAPEHRGTIVRTGRGAGRFLDATVHCITCDATHAHVLASWRHRREPESVRRSIRHALSRALNAAHGKRDWFAELPSVRRVRGYDHFDYLVLAYLPRHDGVCWVNEATRTRCEARDALRSTSVTRRRRRGPKKGQSKPK